MNEQQFTPFYAIRCSLSSNFAIHNYRDSLFSYGNSRETRVVRARWEMLTLKRDQLATLTQMHHFHLLELLIVS